MLEKHDGDRANATIGGAAGAVEEREHREENGLVATPWVSIGHAPRCGFEACAGVMRDDR